MASRASCFRETTRQGRPRLVRAFIYLSIYLHSQPVARVLRGSRKTRSPSRAPTIVRVSL